MTSAEITTSWVCAVVYTLCWLNLCSDIFCEEDGSREFGKQAVCPACKLLWCLVCMLLHQSFDGLYCNISSSTYVLCRWEQPSGEVWYCKSGPSAIRAVQICKSYVSYTQKAKDHQSSVCMQAQWSGLSSMTPSSPPSYHTQHPLHVQYIPPPRCTVEVSLHWYIYWATW